MAERIQLSAADLDLLLTWYDTLRKWPAVDMEPDDHKLAERLKAELANGAGNG